MAAKLFTAEEVAELASVTPRTIRNYLKAGRLEGRKIDGQWRFTNQAVQRLLSGEDMLRMENYTEPLLTIEDHFLDDDADKDFDLDSLYTLNYQHDEQVYTPSERENAGLSSGKMESAPLSTSGSLGASPALSPAHPSAPPPSGMHMDESFRMQHTNVQQPPAAHIPNNTQGHTPLPYTMPPPNEPPANTSGGSDLGASAPPTAETYQQRPAMQAMPYGYQAYPGMYPLQQQMQQGMPQDMQQPQQPMQQGMQAYPSAQGNNPNAPNMSVFFAPSPAGHMQGPYADPYYSMGGYPLYPRSPMPPTGMYYPPPEPQQPAPQPPQPPAPKVDTPLASSRLEANGVQYDLSDIGHKVALFAAEVHDCSDGPQMCTMIDLHQSLATAKITSERLTEIARQESENGLECTCYVEFDSRYYVARYTLFGSLDFLVRCLKLVG